MKKELVLVKDLNNYWCCALCVTCTEGKNIIDVQEAIDLIKNEYSFLLNADFVQEGNDVFALVNESFSTINADNLCK